MSTEIAVLEAAVDRLTKEKVELSARLTRAMARVDELGNMCGELRHDNGKLLEHNARLRRRLGE
jgi:predicted nuclease with TOPRIM domain